MSTLSEINDYQRIKKSDIFSLVETKHNDSENVPVWEGQYNVWRRNKNKTNGMPSNGNNKEECDNGEGGKERRYGRGVEGRVSNDKLKEKRLGSRIRTTKDQCLGERILWKHDERDI